MKLEKLRKQYGRISADERLELVLGAFVRGDQSEADSLNDSAPKLNSGPSHHYPLFASLQKVAFIHLIDRFERAGMILQRLAFLDDPKVYEDLLLLLRSYQVRVEGWNRFCATLGHDPRAILPIDVSNSSTFAAIETIREEVSESLQSQPMESGEGAPLTADSVAADYRSLYESLIKSWHLPDSERQTKAKYDAFNQLYDRLTSENAADRR